MPRPMNLTMGEGRYKGIGAANMGPSYVCPEGNSVFNSNDCASGGPASDLTPFEQIQAEIDALFSYTGAGQDYSSGLPSTSTIGEWVQKNSTLLLVGGAVGLLLFSRRM